MQSQIFKTIGNQKTTKKPLVNKQEPAFVIQLAAFRSAEKQAKLKFIVSSMLSSRLHKVANHAPDRCEWHIFSCGQPTIAKKRQKRCTNSRRADRIVFGKFTAPEGKFSSMVVVHPYMTYKHR